MKFLTMNCGHKRICSHQMIALIICWLMKYSCEGATKKFMNIEKVSKQEQNVSISTCSEFEFSCKTDGSCIPLLWTCDLAPDCSDGSDEITSNCDQSSVIQNQCDNDSFFHCKYSRKCIPKRWLCDQIFDCGMIGKFNLLDPSDEENSQNCRKICPVNKLPCNNGVCLHISKFCDGNIDCPNDEFFCNDQSPCSNLKCDYACKITPHGPKCYCQRGYDILNSTKCVVQKDSFKCFEEDLDEEICDQHCINSEGKNKCFCALGYERIEKRCLGLNDHASSPTLLFVLSSNHLYKIIVSAERNVSSRENIPSDAVTQVLNLENSIGLEIDFVKSRLCILGNSEIYCFNVTDFLKKEKLPDPDFLPGVDLRPRFIVTQFKLDWISRNWYFSLPNLIFVCSSEMKFCKIIINTESDAVKIQSFVIDPSAGYLFLAKYDPKSREGAGLLRYSMDGSNMTNLLNDKLFYPNDLTLDVAMKTVYFLDHYFDFIQQCDYDGSNRKFLQKLPLMKFQRIVFFEDTFYGVLSKNATIAQVRKSSTLSKKILAENLETYPKILKIFHQQIQPLTPVSRVCTANHKCDHLCIPILENDEKKNSILVDKCICQEGFRLENGKCKIFESKQFLMYVQSQPRMLKAVDAVSSQSQVITPIIGLKTNIAFDVDLMDQVIFYTSYSDINSGSNSVIEFQSFNGSNRGSLKGNSFGTIQSIAYDWIGKNLYFTSQSPKMIIGAAKRFKDKEDALIKTLITKNLIGPCSLALDPQNGLMFWSSFADNYNAGGKIEMSWMDGSSRQILAAKGINGNGSIFWPVSLTYYKKTKKLYWLDVLSQTIDSISLDDLKIREQRKVGAFYSQSMAVISEKIFWTDNAKNTIEAAPISSTDLKSNLKVVDRSQGKKTFLRKADYDDYTYHIASEKQIQCPGLWLPTPTNGICLCGDGFSMNAIGTSCIKSTAPSKAGEILRITCANSDFSCASNDQCVDPKFVCDGQNDCSDGSDERELPEGPCPIRCDFKCDGSRCIEKHQLCDGSIDCIDESDENVDLCYNATDSDDYALSADDYCDEFLCDNGNCVPYEQRCDSVDNCGDYTDESNCPPVEKNTRKNFASLDSDDQDDSDPFDSSEDFSVDIEDCRPPDYYCAVNRKCIPVHQLCDGIIQCSDKSDELGRCNEKLCDHFTECQFFCHEAPNPNGFVCYCPQHMTLEKDGRTCSSPQICDDFSTCSHFCENQNQTKVKCKCFHGYRMKEDNFTCESVIEEDPVLMFSNRHILRGIKLNKKHTDVKSYYSTAKNLIGLDFYYDRHSKEYLIFWSDITQDKIFSGKFHNDELMSIKPIVESDLSTTEAVAIDWIGKNLYWVDSSLRQIEVSTKDGLHRATLISENISKPRSMAIDSRFGYLFWSDWDDDEPRIERSTLAGEHRKSIFSLKVIGGSWPNGITIDFIKKRVFFLDAKSKEIHTIGYDGENHKRILKNPEYLHHPFGITIYENSVFWTDWRLSSVIKADKFTGNNVTIFYHASTQPFDVKVVHPSRQPWDFNGEGSSKTIISQCENNPCSHLCLLSTNSTYKCKCPHMMRLNNDNQSICEKVDKILFYITDKPEIRAIELNHPYSNAISTIYHSSLIMAPNHIAIHSKSNRIFWTDAQLKEIKQVKLSTSIVSSSQKIETLLDTGIHYVHSFAIDWKSNLLFFSQSIFDNDRDDSFTQSYSGENHRLLVSNLKGEFLSIIFDNINIIQSLVVSSEERKIYYVIIDNENSEQYMINQCDLDGSDIKNLIYEDEVVESLTLDISTNRLYFIKNNRKIFYFDFVTKKTKLVNTFYGEKSLNDENDLFITSIDIFENEMYFGENSTNSIRKCDKNECKVSSIYRENTKNVKQLKIMTLSDGTDDSADINGCYLNVQGNEKKCDHLCIPKGKSSFICKCSIGYQLDISNTSKCVGSDDVLIYSLGHELRGLSINNISDSDLLTPLQKINVISKFDFDAATDFIYIADNERGEIVRLKKDGSERKVILYSSDSYEQSQNDWLGGIAVDWIGQNLYWTDQKRGLIEVSRLDGRFRRVISTQIFKPSLIAVDPLLGVLFFVDGKYKIIRQDLDGSLDSKASFYVTKSLGNEINGLTLDTTNQMIYVCEAKTNKIWGIEYDGNGRRDLDIKDLSNPTSVDIFEGNLFWSEIGSGTIKSVRLSSLRNPVTLKTSLSQMRGLRIFSTKKQHGSNPCAMPFYGGCRELCLFNGIKANCLCSTGYLDPGDLKTCRNYENFLFFSRKDSIEKLLISTENNSLISTSIQYHKDLQNAVALSFDFANQIIYYSDLRLNAIFSCTFFGKNFTKLIDKQYSVEGLAFNPQDNKLFWTLNVDAEIKSADLNLLKNVTKGLESSITSLLKLKKGIDKLRAIAIEPCLAMVYFSNWNNKNPSISRIFVTGFGHEQIITKDIFLPNALTLDFNDKKMFWADARLDKFERCDYDGKNRVILAQSTPKHPFSIAVFEDFIFWSDWMLHGILRANKYSGNDVIFLKQDLEQPMGLFVAQDSIKNCSGNACSAFNGGCEDICLPHKNSFKCECSQGYLDKDGKRCLSRSKISSCDPKAEFECRSGECIPYVVTCDGIKHCSDGSDESVNFCASRKCPEELFFQCRNLRCIVKTEVCDGEPDCGDGSDEENCDCKNGLFRCSSGECIPEKHRCDNDPDCKDASDEMECHIRDCSSVVPEVSDLKSSVEGNRLIPCPHTTACFMKEWECDGENDCWDNSDEKNCENKRENKNGTCGPDRFQCSNGKCIPLQFICDSEDDCGDSEILSDLSRVETVNSLSSDERNCQNHCSVEQFTCENSTLCIPLTWVCDGVSDCPGKSDEKFCKNFTNSTQPTCSPFQIACLNGECVTKEDLCDGKFDCADLSDEMETCLLSPLSEAEIHNCNQTEFQCSDQKCIPYNDVCDMKPDCDDRTDENTTLCENSPLYCQRDSEKFLCASGGCINATLVCNGLNDCGDFSDEKMCNINECEYTNCDHNCTDLKIGFECSCYLGFAPNKNDSHKCDDINECEDRPCSQLCINSYGSYHCECLEGYIKLGNTCKVDSPHHPKLIFSNYFYIRSVSLDGKSELLVHNLSNAVGIDFDSNKNYIYYSDVNSMKSQISRVKLTSSLNTSNNPEILHQQNLKNPDGIAFDWVAKNLYWCDKGLKTIEVSKDNGKYRKVLIDENLDKPRAIVLDPYRKYMYWTDWGSLPHIGRAGMDGSDSKYIVTGNLGWPNALTISFETNELFFGDAKEDFISVCDFEGKNRKIIAHRRFNPALNLNHIFSIAVWEDKIYFSDWETKSIEYCDKYTGNNCGTLIKLVHRSMDLKVFHPIRQTRLRTRFAVEQLQKKKTDITLKKKVEALTTKENPCATANCSALCLLSPIAPFYKCACPDNFYLHKDSKSCVANCTNAQFLCIKSLKCIPFFWKCDGQSDCEFNEDELGKCPPFFCTPGEFQCDLTKTNSTCLEPPAICDGIKQCRDGKDEENCDSYGCFIESQFQCEKTDNSTIYCISDSKRCNNKIDCPTGNDEKDCPPRSCSASEFQCESNDLCIPKVWQCDGDSDCLDRSDEKNCMAKTCSLNESKCPNGRCIPLNWLCDGESDCSDGSDEGEKAKCDTIPTSNSCDPSYFRCNSTRKCIPGRWKCDNVPDCEDYSDEENCPLRNCSESEFQCFDGHCIKGSFKCDGEYNCFDASDELNCNVTCGDSLFKCENQKQCVSKHFLCDGEPDCLDYSDEKNCGCSKNDFKCRGNYEKCILNDWICDGIIDCPDGSDEHDSRCLTRSCVGNAVKCTNGKCIPKYLLCDGNNNCGDNSDEMKCIDKNADSADNKLGCKFGSCSQLCFEKGSKGAFHCKCSAGYHKLGFSKNATCRAIEGQHLIFTASESELRFIYGLNYGVSRKIEQPGSIFKGSGMASVMPIHSFVKTNSSKITSFDFVINDDEDITLFWIDSVPSNTIQKLRIRTRKDFEKIKESGFDGRDSTVLFANQVKDTLKAISVDWLTSKLYLIENDMIKAVGFDGQKKRTIVDAGPNSYDLVLDPESRRLFWSTMMRVIFVSSMDGSQKKRFVTDNIEFASGLSIDYPSRRLYWCDLRKGTIETVNLDGTDRKIVRDFKRVDRLNHLSISPMKLDIFEDELHVIMTNQTLYKFNKFGWKNDHEELNNGKLKFKASHIKIIHTFKRSNSLPNPCLTNPCDDSAVCYLSSTNPHQRSCNCPDDLYIQKNGSNVSCLHRSEISSLCFKNCVNGGKCKYVDNEMVCQCPSKYEGEFCEHYLCSEYCKNQGVCILPTHSNSFSTAELKTKRICHCPSDWKGSRCEIPSTACENKCLNGGTCHYEAHDNGSLSETCVCSTKFSGSRCEICDAIECLNGGTCRNSGTLEKYRCICPDRFKGLFCETDRCADYCKNGGTCSIRPVTGPMCICDNNYSGERCENDDLCLHCGTNSANCLIECKNNGYCRKDSKGVESCVCVGDWSGNVCETPPKCIDECGKCSESSSINECVCKSGLVQPCLIADDVVSSEMLHNDHEIVTTLIFTLLLLSTLVIVAIILVRKLRRRSFFAHARLNENVEEITNPIFDFAATETDDIVLPVTNISNDDDKSHFSNPLYESMYASSHKGLLERKSDDEEEVKRDLF